MDLSPDKPSVILLLLAIAGWYVAARSAKYALAGARRAPELSAIAFSIPTILFALGGVVAGRSEVAIGAIFAGAVTALTLVLGIALVAGPAPATNDARRVWLFVLPAALIGLMIGFSAAIRWIHVAILALEGLSIFLFVADENAQQPGAMVVRRRFGAARIVTLLLSVAAAALASKAALIVVAEFSARLHQGGLGLMTALVAGPALVLPLIGYSAGLAYERRVNEAVTTLVVYALVALCAILPLVSFGWLTRPYWASSGSVQSIPATGSATTESSATTLSADDRLATPTSVSQALPFPIAVWRIDAVLLVVVGLLLLPAGLGRWALGRAEGYALIGGYLFYMILNAAMARPG